MGQDNSSESSLTLMARARAGDADARDALFTRYLPRLRRWAHGRLPAWARDTVDTQDLVQETLKQVVRRVPEFEPRHDAAFPSYMRRALMNRIRDEMRRAKPRPSPEALDAASPAETPSPLEEAIGRETLERYETALERLEASDRELIIARLELGMSHQEIAAELGKPSGAAAHMAVSRALVRLAREMSG